MANGGAGIKALALVGLLVATLIVIPRAWAGRAADDTPSGSLQQQIEAYLDDRGGTYGVTVCDLENGQMAAVNATTRFPTASLYKLLVMYRVYGEVEAGRLSLDDEITVVDDDAQEGEPEAGLFVGDTVTVGAAVDRMITVSSNAAAYALARTVGGWDAVESVPSDLGMTATQEDTWWGTPNDFARYFRSLDRGRLISPEASEQMLAVLSRQTRNDRIPASLPEEVQVAHKTGELDGVRNDAGIVTGPGVHYVIVLMSKDVDPAEATEVEAEISGLVYDYLSATSH